jgi:tetratricopeptide (TPR) repeat protein
MNDYVETFTIINEAVRDENYDFAITELNKLCNEEHPINVRYVATLRLGEIYFFDKKDFDNAISYLMKSYTSFERIEGLMYLIKIYFESNRTLLAYALGCVCVITNEFEGSGCDKMVYEFERYYLMAKICLRMKKYEEANELVKKAIDGIGEKGYHKHFDDETYDNLIVELRKIFEQSATGMIPAEGKPE